MKDKRDQVHDEFTQKQADKWSPELDYKKDDTIFLKREKKLEIQVPWYETPYRIYQVYENNTCNLIDKNGEFFRSRVNGKNLKLYHDNTEIFTSFKISDQAFIENYYLGGSNVELLLVILTSCINILVLYLLVLLAIYLQVDIYLRFI